MLIEKSKYKPGDIISFKLINGDEIVGKFIAYDNQLYEINRPCIILTTPEGIGVLQAMFGLDPDRDNLHYWQQHIVSMCQTHDKLKEHYLKVLEEGAETESFLNTSSAT